MNKVFFSIVIAAYNAEKTINKTIQSVLMQSFTDYQIIVKDAKSTDTTIEQIPVDDRIKTISCADKGVYDGMNQAIEYCNGEYILFLNCGDILYDENVLANIYMAISGNRERPGIVYGNIIRDGMFCKQAKQLSKFYFYRRTLCHQSVFFHDDIFDKYSAYNLKYSISADYDKIFRAYVEREVFQYVDIVVSVYEGKGLSETERGLKAAKRESELIKSDYLSQLERCLFKTAQTISLGSVRNYIDSDKCPYIVRKIYVLIRNRLWG